MAGKYLFLRYHFVWSTLERKPMIELAWRDRLYAYFGGILRQRHASLLCSGGAQDHVHLYVSLPSTISVADAVNVVKVNSSRWVKSEIESASTFAWQEGYAAFTVSKSVEEAVTRYIRDQASHHARMDFRSELVALLRRHEVEFDDRYLLD